MTYAETFSYKIHALTYAIDMLAHQVLKQYSDLNFAQFLILLCFTENPGETQKFASEWLQITEATVSYMIKRMKTKDYLSIEGDVQDRRVKKIYPTSSGTATINRLYPLLEKALKDHLDTLSSEQIKVTTSVFDSLMQSIMQQNKP